ncbi:MAG: hypothetical protein JWN68_2878 [Nocardioides sp.]|jgi:hypothetical protein|nr:hypothetical protein [Nocardioides sp.]
MSITIGTMATLGTKIASVLVALCAATVLGACGSESGSDDTAADPTSQPTSESPSTSAEPSALPECADVWVDGADLPKDYTACTTDGVTVKPVKRTCGYGAKFLEQEGRFFAIKGNRITDAGDLETSEEYQQILAACQA